MPILFFIEAVATLVTAAAVESTDTETEDKKQGYERDSKQYKPIFKEIGNTYKETREL